MKFSLLTVLAASTLITLQDLNGSLPRAQEPLTSKKSSVWMKLKLTASQKVLEGMTRADFKMVARHAQIMSDLGFLESWVRGKRSPEYQRQLQVFSHANQELLRQANKKNLEGMTLAFNQLTTSCAQCHREVRDLQKAGSKEK